MTKADIGVYGLGTMGSALALNIAEHGFRVAVSNRELPWISDFITEAGALGPSIQPCETLEDFVLSLKTPRVILFMIPSGTPLDQMIGVIAPLLEAGDTIIDGGNADFNDTRRRFSELEGKGLHFVGMGVSGGEEGARFGPSMMVGGTAHSWQQLRPMAEAISAKFQSAPCVDHLGPDGAGHFVKTIHNGIEYADMQMIAEVYGLLRDGDGWNAARIGAQFCKWNDGPLRSYLIEATGEVLAAVDPETGSAMVDVIEDRAGQKGTGRWTVIEALKLGQSANGIEAAVGARGWSADKDLRIAASDTLEGGEIGYEKPSGQDMALGFEAARILAHAQGFAVMQAASDEFAWDLDLARIAEIWRAGCIIRSALLDDLSDAIRADPPSRALILAPVMAERLAKGIPALRRVVSAAVVAGLPAPALSAVLAWYDSLRHARGTANLIQAQRDFFGAHGFERVDQPGKHHGPWSA
ncbi:6-phosphogluconate dehydrogenase [Shimia gijangensis]|uniref:6-phosphogluconate dehydrogenase, decarboxylating n=1 Tax=Shimia gijangensis TaxID=1470563 RepID=A0A1M6IAV3_9RHOB|nr:NADP-dependent phosphogluconate dehydrogenase [Shimia gijangensis]SHJ31564.1 6-phosphogluconate dehydrogenase [Shimia gijangensis]